jgi:succinoglycan biosynthesis protein ExoA
VLNEEIFVRRAITSLLPPPDDLDYELIVLDGGSTDATQQIIEELIAANRRIRLVTNDARIQSAAINKGVRIAQTRSQIIIRADCHADYPPGFVLRLIHELREREVASVVVPMRAAGNHFFQRAIAAAQNSRMGNGGSPHRRETASRYVKHGHHAAFDRTVFERLGGYDETFSHNEDAEFDYRLTSSGGRLWLCADLTITYFPRESFIALASQYVNYGSGRARTTFKHGIVPEVRQALPIALLIINVGGLGIGLLSGWPFFAPVLAYLGVCTMWSAALVRSRRDMACLAAGCAAGIMHHSWAAGFVYESLRLLVRYSMGMIRGCRPARRLRPPALDGNAAEACRDHKR